MQYLNHYVICTVIKAEAASQMVYVSHYNDLGQ